MRKLKKLLTEVVAEGKDIDEDCELEEGCGEISEDKSQKEIDADIKKAKNPGDGAESESYKGKKFKKSVVGVDDDNIDKKSREGKVYEDSEAKETDRLWRR